MTLWENVLAHYGWQGAALAAVLVVLLCVQLWYYLFAYGRIPGYKNSRRRQVLDAEPPLSVIVPMFSEDALFVEERLPLMLAQEYSDFEVVIVYVGRDNDFFEDLLRIRQSFPRVTATKIEQDARFPISTKMALNVGIKSAHYEHLIVTSTDVRPLSDRWLALMAKGFPRRGAPPLPRHPLQLRLHEASLLRCAGIQPPQHEYRRRRPLPATHPARR